MFEKKKICVLLPAYNEENQIGGVLKSIPTWVDAIVVVDDGSNDRTAEVVHDHMPEDRRIHMIRHESNQGVGASVASGYKWARDEELDIVVLMAGDGQTDPLDLPRLVSPVARDEVDFCKGNRFFSGEAFSRMPKLRFFGNAFLSMFTKIASGYWHIADSQTGYTAINLRALKLVDWDRMYKKYGQPNDLLIRLNVYDMRVKDVPINPLYHIGEQSKMRIGVVIFTISWLLVRMFFWRMKEKYIIRNFHPLIFFYALAFALFLADAVLAVRLVIGWMETGFVPQMTFLALMFGTVSGLQTLFFAMWFDMESNKVRANAHPGP